MIPVLDVIRNIKNVSVVNDQKCYVHIWNRNNYKSLWADRRWRRRTERFFFFYEKLEWMYFSSSKYYNGKSECKDWLRDGVWTDDRKRESARKISHGNCNRTIHLATYKRLVVSGTYFLKKDIHVNRISPYGKTKNKIDHVKMNCEKS